MTLPASGAISFNAINVELGVAGTTTANINQASYRTLAGVASGTISLSSFYGKSNRAAISYTYSSNTANASLNVTSIGGYTAGKSDITITVSSAVYLYSTSTGTPGLTLSGGAAGDTVTIVNNGFILGMGGAGRTGNGSAGNGNAAGLALQLGFNTTVNNTNGSAYIAGGGGGGASRNGGGGGGAGGASGGGSIGGGGGAGGGPGSAGSAGGLVDVCGPGPIGGGGGGGRILPGTGGSAGSHTTAAGGGGSGGGGGAGGFATPAAAGGSGTAAGGNAPNGFSAGGGGGWGASGGTTGAGVGGAGGKAVNLNGRTITWTSGNTTRVYGSVS